MKKILIVLGLLLSCTAQVTNAEGIVVLNSVMQDGCTLRTSATLTNHDAGSYTAVEIWNYNATVFIATIDSIAMPAGIDEHHSVDSFPLPLGITPGNYTVILRMKDFSLNEAQSAPLFITLTDCTMSTASYELESCHMLTNSEGVMIMLGNEYEANASVFDLSGKMQVSPKRIFSGSTISLQGLSSGMYIVSVLQDNRKKTFKVFWQ